MEIFSRLVLNMYIYKNSIIFNICYVIILFRNLNGCYIFYAYIQVLDQKDPNWWQAKKVGDNELPGLIPSQELEERRKAFVAPEADYVHKTSICGTRVHTF